jgi:hypothetical protein
MLQAQITGDYTMIIEKRKSVLELVLLSSCQTGIPFYSQLYCIIGVHDFRFAPILLDKKREEKNQERTMLSSH